MSCSESLGELRVNVHQDLVLQIGVHHFRSVLGLQKLLYSCLICWTIDRPFGQQRVRENLPVIFGGLDRAISADIQNAFHRVVSKPAFRMAIHVVVEAIVPTFKSFPVASPVAAWVNGLPCFCPGAFANTSAPK